MTIDELLDKYVQHKKLQDLNAQLNFAESTVLLSGLNGSSASLWASALLRVNSTNQLFILPDKEEAAYFFNDIENLNPEDKKSILFYPASYKRPYQLEEVDNANVMQRAEVLNAISKRSTQLIIITYPEALTEKVVSKKHLKKNSFDVKKGDNLSIDFLNELLISYEFDKVDYVIEPGQFAVRGGIVDIFSFSNEYPYRLEFFGDEIESIRTFNIEDQLSVSTIQKLAIIPNVQGKLLTEQRTSFLEFLPASSKIWCKDYDLVVGKIGKGFDTANYAFEKLDTETKHLTPEELYINADELTQLLQERSLIAWGNTNTFKPDLEIKFANSPQPAFNKNFEILTQNIVANKENGINTIFVSDNPKQIERIYQIFEDLKLSVEYTSLNLGLREGFIDLDIDFALYTDHQIFERYHKFRLREKFDKSQEQVTLKEIYKLKKGDFVVHIDHGVGQFSGMEKINVNGKEQEAIRLIYSGSDILYVSIHSLHRIAKYTGKEGKQPKLNKLGSPAWKKLKSKTKARVKQVAFNLIKLYARRKAQKGFAFSQDNYLQHELEASFMYEDTPDQFKATQAVKSDMEKEAPMDRLVCGDVGFGKTEIAIRAAFKAVCDSKQVAVLVPTTILALQHSKSFIARFKDFPCNVDYINRFRTTKQNNAVLKKLESGELDIIIGTHKLLGDKIKFKDLGLLIIDEEQKFGVGAKDKLKTIKQNVDTLTLTATPIPRTLQFSLMKARDLSIIATPPPNRQPVHTELVGFNEEAIRDAIMYEVKRGGQAYFVNNRIQNIKEVAGMLQRLCPDIRIGIGHGQMEGPKLEALMLDFIEGMYDVLLATSIIESGIDIPNANTIIINNAQNFGLSDLHQLRGRVGRSNKKAFCYLITPPLHMISTDSRKRLRAIEQFSELGSGFNIAMKDLDIRGAGDILGGEQSGFINEMGMETYQKILNEAIEELKQEEFQGVFDEDENADFVQDIQIETDLELLIPDDYVNNIAERLSLYRELDEVSDEPSLNSFRSRLKDRFGDIPDETEELLKTLEMRWTAKAIGMERLVIKNQKMIGYFITNQESPYYQSPQFTEVLNFIKTNPRDAKMSEKNDKLRLIYSDVKSIDDAMMRLKRIRIVKK